MPPVRVAELDVPEDYSAPVFVSGATLAGLLSRWGDACRFWRDMRVDLYNALRNSVGVTPTTRRKTCAKWLGLV